MQLTISPTFLGVPYRQVSSPEPPVVFPPNPEQVLQWLGDSYLGDDGSTYIEDKTDNGYNAKLGGSSVLVGDGESISINHTGFRDVGTLDGIYYLWEGRLNNLDLQGIIGHTYAGPSPNRGGIFVSANLLYFQSGGSNFTSPVQIGLMSFGLHCLAGVGYCYIDGVMAGTLNYTDIALFANDMRVLSYGTSVNGDTAFSNSECFRYSYGRTQNSILGWFDNAPVEGELISVTCSNFGGTKVYNGGNPTSIIGDHTSMWQRSLLQTPYNRNNGYDLWTHSTLAPIYMPIGTTCVEVGYSYFKTVQGVTEGLNGSENGIIMPNEQALKDVANLMDNNIYFDAQGNPTEYFYDDIQFDQDGKKVIFTQIEDDHKYNQLVYSSPQEGTDYNRNVEALDMLDLALRDPDGNLLTETVTREYLLEPNN